MLKRRTSVSSGSRWSSVDMIYFIIALFNRLVARVCISLSSGISMFARWSLTRVDLIKSQLSLSRGGENTKSYVNWIRLTADWR